MAQLIRITSEALQATVRRLLPSQQGFGEDLQASNVITPIIDLTPSAEGSEVRQDLQTAFSLNSLTEFSARNNTVTIANSAGFYRVICATGIIGNSSNAVQAEINITDGTTTKQIYDAVLDASTSQPFGVFTTDFVVFLNAGETCQATTSNDDVHMRGSSWQIADVNGNLQNPSGFTPQ